MAVAKAATSLLDELDERAQTLSPEQQIEFARRLLNRATPVIEEKKQYRITDWIGMGKGTWKTAEDVRNYIEEERNSWER